MARLASCSTSAGSTLSAGSLASRCEKGSGKPIRISAPAPRRLSLRRFIPARLGRSTSNKLRILIHGLNFAPELVGVGKYTDEMAQWLADRGHEVRVVTAPPFNPQWKVTDGFSSWR